MGETNRHRDWAIRVLEILGSLMGNDLIMRDMLTEGERLTEAEIGNRPGYQTGS